MSNQPEIVQVFLDWLLEASPEQAQSAFRAVMRVRRDVLVESNPLARDVVRVLRHLDSLGFPAGRTPYMAAHFAEHGDPATRAGTTQILGWELMRTATVMAAAAGLDLIIRGDEMVLGGHPYHVTDAGRAVLDLGGAASAEVERRLG